MKRTPARPRRTALPQKPAQLPAVIPPPPEPAPQPGWRRCSATLGYRDSTAMDAVAALAVLAQGETVDLLFTDVVLPGQINGPGLAQLALADRPHPP